MKKYLLKLEEIATIVDNIRANFTNGVIILDGEVASGKTTLVQAYLKELGLNDEVTSPTFSLQHSYSNDIYHYDIYNHGLDHFISLGMLDELDKKGIHFVEWGSEGLMDILKSAEIPYIKIEIKKVDERREYKICTY